MSQPPLSALPPPPAGRVIRTNRARADSGPFVTTEGDARPALALRTNTVPVLRVGVKRRATSLRSIYNSPTSSPPRRRVIHVVRNFIFHPFKI